MIVAVFVAENVEVDGPLTCSQRYDAIFPSASEDEPPFRFVVLVGSVMVRFEPALATGAWFAAAVTVTVTVALSDSPSSSVTVSLYV